MLGGWGGGAVGVLGAVESHPPGVIASGWEYRGAWAHGECMHAGVHMGIATRRSCGLEVYKAMGMA